MPLRGGHYNESTCRWTSVMSSQNGLQLRVTWYRDRIERMVIKLVLQLSGCMFALNDQLIEGWYVYSLGATVRVLQLS